MIYHLEDLRSGFDLRCDAVVVGSGAAGAVAATNLAASGMRTVLLESGPLIRPEQMTRNAPHFMARYYWEGGMRQILGRRLAVPFMQGRCLGGSTVVNSAIMFALPDWVKDEWVATDGIDFIHDASVDRSFDRIMERTGVSPTDTRILGKRNLVVLDALEAMGIEGKPLPRAVVDCKGCGDCITGCFEGKKQSVERSWLPGAVEDGCQIYTSSTVERVLTRGRKVIGVQGSVIDREGSRRLARFTVRAPLVVMAAGVATTPCILLSSRINPRRQVGATFNMHLTGGSLGIMEEVIDPWVGATQGVGAISEEIKGLKFECVWAPPSLIGVRWGGIGRRFLNALEDIKHAVPLACICRAPTRGRVGRRPDGSPFIWLDIPRESMRPIQRGMFIATQGLLKTGARYVYTGAAGVKNQIRNVADAETLLRKSLKPGDIDMTGNHAFGSVRMSRDPKRGPVDLDGYVRGVEGLMIVDTSIFPSPTAVNPQATVMMLADILTRRAAGMEA